MHDAEDAIVLQHVSVGALDSPAERESVVATALRLYAQQSDQGSLEAALNRLIDLPAWPRRFDGTHRDLASLKDLTSTLIGRFARATQDATLAAHGPGPHIRYGADLVVPTDIRAEVAVMKGLAAYYMMFRPGSAPLYQRQHELIRELVGALVRSEGRELDTWAREFYDAAADDAERLRVVLDQVASLTDVSVLRWHERLCP